MKHTDHRKQLVGSCVAFLAPIVGGVVLGCSSAGQETYDLSDVGTLCDGACADSDPSIDGSEPETDSEAGVDPDSGEEGGWDKDAFPPGDCNPQPLPPGVPEGWEEFPVLDCRHRLYVPSGPEFLPRLSWEPCPSEKWFPLPGCRHIKMDWPSAYPSPYGIHRMQAYVDLDGQTILLLEMEHHVSGFEGPKGHIGMIVPADGPAKQAFFRRYVDPAEQNYVFVHGASAARGKSAWFVGEYIAGEWARRAAIGGADTVLRPAPLFEMPSSTSLSVSTDSYLLDGKNRQVFAWDGTLLGNVNSSTVYYRQMEWVGQALLFTPVASSNHAIWHWTKQYGSRVLVGFGGAESKSAASSGSDGIDIVWLQGEGQKEGTLQFAQRWIMTSKYSTDPAKIQPRRLTRWESDSIFKLGEPTPVGCGYAVYVYREGDPLGMWSAYSSTGLILVRLADGVHWKLPSRTVEDGDAWVEPLAITCEEVFASYLGDRGIYTVRRVPLKSLGAGLPAVK